MMEGEAEEETTTTADLVGQECGCEVQELVDVIESVSSIADYRLMQKKESLVLVRRLKILLLLLEEIKELHGQVPETCSVQLSNLKKALLSAKQLLITCSEGSKIYLAAGNDAIMGRFHNVNRNLSRALEDLPYEELGVSEEVKEEMELVRMHLKRFKGRTDSQDVELGMDMMVVFSKDDDKGEGRKADRAIIARLANKLELHSVAHLDAETIAVRKLVRESSRSRSRSSSSSSGGKHAADTVKHVIELLSKFRRSAGLEDVNVLEDPIHHTQPVNKSSSLLNIPDEFLCPITLEIMTDPVFIETGQTYERESIEKWLETHRTCPKTRQPLTQTMVAPNYALRNVILTWCDKHKVELPKKDRAGDGGTATEGPSSEVLSAVKNLSSTQLEVQRKAARKIRLLSKENPVNRVAIAKSGGIPPLVHLLSYPDSKIQEHSVTALLNLSIDEANKKLIDKEGAIPAIIEVLRTGSTEAKENSATALFSLSMVGEIKERIVLCNGIPPLVELLREGTKTGKKDAATALAHLCMEQANKTRAIEAGIVGPLIKLVKESYMIDEVLSILYQLSSHPDGPQEIAQFSLIETLVALTKAGTPTNKEWAATLLLALASTNSSILLIALQFGALQNLIDISDSGNPRAQRKAKSLLKLMRRSEHI